jgi:hypothetical protein
MPIGAYNKWQAANGAKFVKIEAQKNRPNYNNDSFN